MKSYRFRTAAVALALALTLGLGACSNDDAKTDAAAPAGDGFPVTIDHLFGSTTIKTKPKRIVAIGGGDLETAIALGAAPIAGAGWFGNTEMRTWVKVDPGVIKNAVFNNLATVKAKHVAYFGGAPVINSNSDRGQFSSAFSIGGPLGIKYVISKIGPLLKPALAGTN